MGLPLCDKRLRHEIARKLQVDVQHLACRPVGGVALKAEELELTRVYMVQGPSKQKKTQYQNQPSDLNRVCPSPGLKFTV